MKTTCTLYQDLLARQWILAVVFLLFPISLIAQTSQKTALLIAIGNYQQQEEQAMNWSSLSANNDVRHLKSALLTQGFEEADILVLQDENATKANILDALNNKLPSISSKGGSCIIHFSGHGQQMFDDNEEEADGLDEALVPYDAPKRFVKGIYEGEKHIRDDELNAALVNLRQKLGPKGQVLVTLDACHSGTGLRAESTSKARGTDLILASKDYLSTIKNIKVEQSISLFNNQPDMGKVVGIYAAAPYQLNYECRDEEGKGVGSLSYTLGQALAKARKEDSYEVLFARIQGIMARKTPEQRPQAEGALQLSVLGGQLSGNQCFYRISQWKNPQEIRLNGGLLHGLAEESTFIFFPDTVSDFQRAIPLAKGKIIRSHLAYADVQLTEGEVPKSQQYTTKAVLEKRQFAYALNVQLGEKIPVTDRQYLSEQIDSSLAFSRNPQMPDIILRYRPEFGLKALTSNGIEVSATQSSAQLWRKLEKYYAADFLRQLECETPTLAAKLELVTKEGAILKDSTGKYALKKGQAFQCRITNESTERLYYTIIDIDAANDITVIAPYCNSHSGYDGQQPEDLYIAPGQQVNYNFDFEVSEPLGLDVLKLVTSRRPIDLSYVVTRGVRGTKMVRSPFEFLFRAVLEGRTRGAGDFVLDGGSGFVGTVLLWAY